MIDRRVRIDAKDVPADIDRWNWGAFLLNWTWGVGNNTFIALLTLVPSPPGMRVRTGRFDGAPLNPISEIFSRLRI
jgi:hypothetical protein